MTAIFLSDVHLRDSVSVKSRLVVRFLQEVASQFEKIYILGDLFDVWPGTNAYLVRTFRPVIQVLKNLVEGGHEIHYIEGNHDFRLGEYFAETLGIKVYPDQIIEQWNGKKIYMTHGDLGNPRQVGYRALRYILRRDLFQRFLTTIPSDFVYKVGIKSSSLSRRYQSQSKTVSTEAQIRQIYRKGAETIFREGYDVVLMGHTHLPDDVTTLVGERSCRYINIGDWVSHFTYLEFDGSQFYTKTHPVKDL
jgi:UDP-2,3-diacylglucosamine hydrolase